MTRRVTFWHGLAAVAVLAFMMIYCVVGAGIDPPVPLIISCAVSCVIAMLCGCKWDDIQKSIIASIAESLEAVVILLLIGMLIGVWIVAGVVPSMIYYGLKLLTPTFFLPATALICGVVSMTVGSWGAAGTIGIAFMGMAAAMGIPPAMAAGAVISGAYLGDVISPLTDNVALCSSVLGENVFDVAKKRLPFALTAFAAAIVFFAVAGLRFGSADAELVLRSVDEVRGSLMSAYSITPVALLPLVIMIVCILVKIPAIPSLFISMAAAGFEGVLMHNGTAAEILRAAYSGGAAETGNQMVDELLSAGGITSMLYAVSVIIPAMMLAGVMKSSGQMDALLSPLVGRVKRQGALASAAVLTCLFVNGVTCDQYVAVALPGAAYRERFSEPGMEKARLGIALGAGGAATSSLFPWNTCGVYMASVLGVSALEYAKFAVFNYMMPVIVIVVSLFFLRGKGKQNEN